jgi:CheY-like chemotaxis protein
MSVILIVDDSAYMRGKIRSILKKDNYEILETDNGLEGLKMVSRHKPDCILIDIIMPELDGLKILKTLQEQKTDIPTIIVTADIQESTRKQCFDLGAYAFVNKPPVEDELLATVKRALSSSNEVIQ